MRFTTTIASAAVAAVLGSPVSPSPAPPRTRFPVGRSRDTAVDVRRRRVAKSGPSRQGGRAARVRRSGGASAGASGASRLKTIGITPAGPRARSCGPARRSPTIATEHGVQPQAVIDTLGDRGQREDRRGLAAHKITDQRAAKLKTRLDDRDPEDRQRLAPEAKAPRARQLQGVSSDSARRQLHGRAHRPTRRAGALRVDRWRGGPGLAEAPSAASGAEHVSTPCSVRARSIGARSRSQTRSGLFEEIVDDRASPGGRGRHRDAVRDRRRDHPVPLKRDLVRRTARADRAPSGRHRASRSMNAASAGRDESTRPEQVPAADPRSRVGGCSAKSVRQLPTAMLGAHASASRASRIEPPRSSSCVRRTAQERQQLGKPALLPADRAESACDGPIVAFATRCAGRARSPRPQGVRPRRGRRRDPCRHTRMHSTLYASTVSSNSRPSANAASR